MNSSSGTCERCLVPGCKNCHEHKAVCIECLPGFYFSFLTKNCQPCHKTCALCSGPQKNDCRACNFNLQKVEFLYDDFSAPLEKKLYMKMAAKFPELQNMPMLQSKTFHPNFDIYCKKSCPLESELDENQFLGRGDFKYGIACPIVKGPHSLDKNAGLHNLHFELGQATDEEQQKLRAKNELEHHDREAARRIVDEHLHGVHNEDEEHNADLHRDNVDSDAYQKTLKKVQDEWKKKREAEKRRKDQGVEGEFNFSGDI